jgi:hypothetical protein
MPRYPAPSRRLPGATIQFLILLVLAILAFVLGVVGATGGIGHRLLTGLSVFQTGFPAPQDDESAALTVAGELGPLVTLAAAASVVFALFRRELNGFRARHRRNHVVICGLGEKGLRIARTFRDDRHSVTCIDLIGDGDAADDARARGALVLAGDATQITTLVTAGVDRAAYVVAAAAADTTNARIAAECVRLADGSRRGTHLFVHLTNAELARVLEGPTLGLEGVRLQFFNVYELWARAMADQAWDVRNPPATPPRVAVVGATPLGRAVAVELGRRWHRVWADSGPIQIALVDSDASAHVSSLEMRYKALGRVAELVAVDYPVSAATPVALAPLLGDEGDCATAYFCLPDDGENLSLALQARHELPAQAELVVPASAWSESLTRLLVDPSTRIEAVGYSDTPDSLDLLNESDRETLARAIHDHYRAGGEVSARAGVPWSKLPEDLRESNRSQVEGIRSLASVWHELVPRVDWDGPITALEPDEVETLATIEHERWRQERLARDWHYGPEPDDEAKRHPGLVPWSELPERIREKDRRAVAEWPEILADSGFDLRRSPLRERLAELIHTRDRAGRPKPGDVRPWSELDEDDRDLSRASADDIPFKLARIDARIAPAFDSPPQLAFSPPEVELLAEVEHERWCATLRARGWSHGDSRDDGARLHPDLVPWPELPDARRDVDREHVRWIPELLSEVGLKAVRVS